MPGDRPSYIQEAAGRTTEDLIERVEYAAVRCNMAGCNMCPAQIEVLTARVHSPTARRANSIGDSQFAEIVQLLERIDNGTTQTTVDSDEERYPRLYEAVAPDIGAATPSSDGPEEARIRPRTGEQLDVTNEQLTLGDRIIQDWIADRDREDSPDTRPNLTPVTRGPVEVSNDPVQSARAEPCQCLECVGASGIDPASRDDVPSSPRRDDRRTAAAARLP